MADDKESKGEDLAREDWIKEHLASFAKVNDDAIKKAFKNEETQEKLKEFLDDQQTRLLVFVGDKLAAHTTLPKKLPNKGKCVYFLKGSSGALKIETIADDVMVGELDSEPLEGLQRVLQDVYIPLLSNSANQEGWGEQAAKDLMQKVHEFLASVSITIGQTKGQTCLPLPPFDQGSTAPGANKDRVHALESSVITWTKQIKNVLKQVSETAWGGEKFI